MLLDLAAFQHQCLELALRDDHIELKSVLDHFRHLGVMRHALAEILRDTRAQTLGLADIDDLAGLVADDIHSRQKRQHFCFFPKLTLRHARPPFLHC